MSKFKVGDRVRRVKHSGDIGNCPIGHETLVEELLDNGGFWYKGENGFKQNSPRPEDWELVSSGPVRTTTKTVTEIVDGVYGRLQVGESGHGKGFVNVKFVDTRGGYCAEPALTAPELTAAIETLTAVRDAMMSNG